jgi:hypothetical protein
MPGAIPPFPQSAFMVWCLVKKAQGQLHLTLSHPTRIKFKVMSWHSSVESEENPSKISVPKRFRPVTTIMTL